VTRRRDVVVVGAGHNGLVAACYLARAGLDVEVVERDQVVGGAVSTVQRWPGVRVDRGSSLHVMVRHTGIVEDLDLTSCGLQYVDADPWAVRPHRDGTLRFAVDVDATCASIADVCGAADADAYASFVATWTPRVEAVLEAFHRAPTPWSLGRAFWPLGRRERRDGGELARSFLQSGDQLLDATFRDERLKAALAWWGAQSGPPTHETGTAAPVASAVLMHLRAAGRPVGGSGALSDALVRRLDSLGGTVRLGDGAVGYVGDARVVRGVRTASGDVVEAPTVVAACHVLTAVDLLGDDALTRDALDRVRVGNGIGMVLRLLTDRLPAYTGDVDGLHSGMQLLVRSRQQLRAAYADFLRGAPATDPPLLVLTPTATDASLAPEGRHVVTVWAQWHPYRLADGRWDDVAQREADRIVGALDAWAPGTAASVVDRWVQTPLDLECELDLRHGNVMHVEMTLDAMFGLRPLPEWSGYRGPRRGLYLCGASTHPGGGVSGASGRSVAGVVLRDLRRARRGLRRYGSRRAAR
jgi:phytoene dehydrogenase-like protein